MRKRQTKHRFLILLVAMIVRFGVAICIPFMKCSEKIKDRKWE